MHQRNPSLAAAALLACALAGCSAKTLPVDLRYCNAIVASNGVSLDVRAVSRATKPIERLSVEVDFGNRRASGVAAFSPPLLPGQSRDARVSMRAPVGSVGAAMRCVPVRIDYAGGAVETAAPTR